MQVFIWFVFASGIISSSALLLGFSGSWILNFHLIEVSEVFFILFLQWIRCLSGITIDTLHPCIDMRERLALSYLISIPFGLFLLVILSDKLADEIYLDLLTDFNVSSVLFIWVDLDLSNDLPLSDLFLMDLSFCSRCLWFLCFVYCANLPFCNGRSDGFLQHISFCSRFNNSFFECIFLH